MRARRIVALLALAVITLFTVAADAQLARVGVVATVQGSATLTRTSEPQGVPLKLRDDVFVADVSADSGCGRLVVHVAIPDGRSTDAVMTELRDRRPQLRAVVATWISRKRVPELTFVPAAAASLGGDEYD